MKPPARKGTTLQVPAARAREPWHCCRETTPLSGTTDTRTARLKKAALNSQRRSLLRPWQAHTSSGGGRGEVGGGSSCASSLAACVPQCLLLNARRIVAAIERSRASLPGLAAIKALRLSVA